MDWLAPQWLRAGGRSGGPLWRQWPRRCLSQQAWVWPVRPVPASSALAAGQPGGQLAAPLDDHWAAGLLGLRAAHWVDIQFIHVKSRHPDPLPLIMTHGWPGSVIELLGSVGPSPTRPRTAGGPRTRSTSCCPHCPATASPASPPRLAGTPARRAGVGRADEAPGLYPLRRPGRQRGRLGHRRDGPPGTPGGWPTST